MIVDMKWGKDDAIRIALPHTWTYRGELASQGSFEPLDETGIRRSLESPVGGLPLGQRDLRGKRVVVVVDDITRPTPVRRLFPMVTAELHKAGVPKDKVTVLFALGNHRPMTGEEMATRLGLDDIGEYLLVNHQWDTAQALEDLGTTRDGLRVVLNRHLTAADLIVLIGTIEPHPIAGFGGGLKNVIPGCAGRETIAGTHLQGPAKDRFSSVGKLGEECLSRRLLEQGALLVKAEYFLVNTVLTPTGKIAGVFCGDPIQAHRQGCELAAKVYGVRVKQKADVVLVGSAPMDIDLWQGSKCFSNASGGLKENGLLVAFVRCNQGLGDLAPAKPFLPPGLMTLFANECGVEKLVDIREKACGPLKTEERFMMELFTELCRRHRILIYAPQSVPKDTGDKLGFFEVYHDVHEIMARALELAPEAETVYSLNEGGTTFVRCIN